MTLFNDHFLMKKKSVEIHYSLKNEIFKKVFHSKRGLWRRTCCCRCVYELPTEDVEEYTRFLTMPPYLFDELLQLIETHI